MPPGITRRQVAHRWIVIMGNCGVVLILGFLAALLGAIIVSGVLGYTIETIKCSRLGHVCAVWF